MDGATMNAIGNNSNGVVTLGMDTVAEVRVLLSNYEAAYGRKAGANVYLVTKSGTKDFHGLVSYFKRHEELNANSFFNNQADVPRRAIDTIRGTTTSADRLIFRRYSIATSTSCSSSGRGNTGPARPPRPSPN